MPVAGQKYELWSVPAFAQGKPETIDGEMIGSAKRAVAPGDVLICKINPRINRVWLVAEPLSSFAQIASPEYLILRTSERAVSAYLRWYLSSPNFRAWIELSVEGATGSHTRAKTGPILRQAIPVPPLAEQRRIVAAIEEQFSRLDVTGRVAKTAARRLQTLQRTLLQSAFAGLPNRPLGDVAQVSGGHTPRGLKTDPDGTIPFYKVGDMNTADHAGRMKTARTYLTPAAAVDYRVRLWPVGTVIFPKQGGAIATNKKRLLTQEAACDLNTMGVMPSRDLEPRFLHAWFETVDLESLSDGSVVAQIKPARVAELRIPVPPVSDQKRIVGELDEQLSLIDSLRGAVQAADKRSTALRRAILERAFRGELVPQDPDDEPASVLLERIRAGRAAGPPKRRKRRAAV
jgi:type I restriction enzyme S subunit